MGGVLDGKLGGPFGAKWLMNLGKFRILIGVWKWRV